MRVTIKELKKLLKNTWKERKKHLLKRVFSFEENIDTFAYYMFPHAIKVGTPSFHREIYDFLFSGDNGALAAPRGFAKSTVVGLFYISWLIVNKKKKYIVYMSQNYKKTVQFVEPLREEFTNNDRLKNVYGDLTPKNVRDAINKKNREDMIDIGGVRVQAVSFNHNIRGFKHLNQRPDLIIGDDIDDDERVLNPDLRRKDRHKLLQQVIPSLSNDEDAKIKLIGTIIHFDSLLMNRIKKYNGKIYKACNLVNNEIDKNSLLWPEYWDKERLQDVREDIGSMSFSQEYLNNPIANEDCIIKLEWLKECCDEDLSYNMAKKIKWSECYDGCDFAFGDRVINDKSAFVAIGVKKGKKTVFNISTYKGLSILQQMRILEQRHKKWRFQYTVMEENSIKSITKELDDYSFNHYLIWTGANDPKESRKHKPEFKGKRHTVGKRNMIMRLAAEIENNNLVFPYKTSKDKDITNQLINECMTFAINDGKLVEVGVHADIPIGLAMGLEKINKGGDLVAEWV